MDLNSSQANNYSSHHFFSSSRVDIDSRGSKYVAFYAELDLNLFGSKRTKGSFRYLIGITCCLNSREISVVISGKCFANP